MTTFVFAAAKDGDVLLRAIEAPTYDEAVDLALGLTADWLDHEGPLDESDLGGFEVLSLQALIEGATA
jgi:hypothetical protein